MLFSNLTQHTLIKLMSKTTLKIEVPTGDPPPRSDSSTPTHTPTTPNRGKYLLTPVQEKKKYSDVNMGEIQKLRLQKNLKSRKDGKTLSSNVDILPKFEGLQV
jgi:hypothetical protein